MENNPADASEETTARDLDVDVIIEEMRTENPMDVIAVVGRGMEEMLSDKVDGHLENGDQTSPNTGEYDNRTVGSKNNFEGVTEAPDRSPQKQEAKKTDQKPSEETAELHKCAFCKKKLPSGNVLLHEIHCEKVMEDKRRLKETSGARKKMDKSKQRNILEKTTEEDFDALIAMAIKSDNRCNFVKCKEKISLTGILCQFCNRRYCFGHNMPEVHGCGEMARSHARKVVHREKAVRAGSGVKERKVDPNRRAHLERKLDKKRSEMEEKRIRKSAKKKWFPSDPVNVATYGTVARDNRWT